MEETTSGTGMVGLLAANERRCRLDVAGGTSWAADLILRSRHTLCKNAGQRSNRYLARM